MGFRNEFLGTDHHCGEWSFVHGTTGFEPGELLLAELRGAGRRILESAAVSVAEKHGDPAFVSEVNYQVLAFEQQESSRSEPPTGNVETVEQGSAELAKGVQRYCDYLGPQLCRIHWAAERLASPRVFKALADSLEPRFRQYFEHGVRQFDFKEYEDAFENFNRVLLAAPTHYFTREYLGFLCVQQDDPEGALAHFQSAHECAEIDRHKALALSHLSRYHYALGKIESAADLARAATEADQDTAAFWYELALYSTMAGQREAGVRALAKAMQKDWTYWAFAVADSHFDALEPHLSSVMVEIRDRMAKKARQVLDGLKRSIDMAKRAGAAESLIKVLLQVDEFDEKQEQGNIYYHRNVILEAADLDEEVQALSKEAVKHRISFWRNALKRAETRREKRIAQLLEPIKQLRTEQRRLGANYKGWEAGCGTYLLLWAGCMALVLFFLLGQPWRDIYIVPYLLSIVIPLLIPPITNKFRYLKAVLQPQRELEDRVRALERQVRPLIEMVERDHADRKKRLEAELNEMELLNEQLQSVES